MEYCKPKQMDYKKVKKKYNKNQDEYIVENKYDGDRMFLLSDGNEHKFLNKRDIDKTEHYLEFEDIDLPEETLIDGEMIIRDQDNPHGNFNKQQKRCSGKMSFKKRMRIKKRKKEGDYNKPVYIAFDLIKWNGERYGTKPLRERLDKLEEIVEDMEASIEIPVRFDDVSDGWDRVTENNLEGLVLKDLESEYRTGRNDSWIKIKNVKDEVKEVDKYEEHSKGIRAETKDGQGFTINGVKASEVKQKIEEEGVCKVEIAFLEKTENGAYRQPVFRKLVE